MSPIISKSVWGVIASGFIQGQFHFQKIQRLRRSEDRILSNSLHLSSARRVNYLVPENRIMNK